MRLDLQRREQDSFKRKAYIDVTAPKNAVLRCPEGRNNVQDGFLKGSVKVLTYAQPVVAPRTEDRARLGNSSYLGEKLVKSEPVQGLSHANGVEGPMRKRSGFRRLHGIVDVSHWNCVRDLFRTGVRGAHGFKMIGQ